MNLNQFIIYVICGCMVIAAVDKIFLNNRLGLGSRFEEGFMAMGSLALSMLGIITMAPVIANILRPIIVPIYQFFGADPAMFAGTILANDMGGYSLALYLAHQENAGLLSGLIVGSMLGATLVFTIPVALGIIQKKDHTFLAYGILIGLITLPLGVFIGGLVAGFPVLFIIQNLLPIILLSALLIIGLWKIQARMIQLFFWFGKGIIALSLFGTVVSVIQTLTPLTLISDMTPITTAFQIIGSITIILIGTFPMVALMTKLAQKPLQRLGSYMGMNEASVVGLIASLANNIPMFGMLKDMNTRGKIINIAFTVCGAFVLGDHLGFTAGVREDMILPVIAGKLAGGISALLLAMWITRGKKEII